MFHWPRGEYGFCEKLTGRKVKQKDVQVGNQEEINLARGGGECRGEGKN